ncbi:NUDIX hydrolase [Streptomyces sp. SID3343]|uniref:NUDIX domain-containing protein n=1 Tax=Streptomyces sp. SID3343 TaxID=2690260 RepID=UPI00136DEBBE|nr:NUDIX hydrolase [Streptomyces sp. SID3343]MYW05052.1 NUDIX domain-containing protein [Streptomyces sp. SID3343]
MAAAGAVFLDEADRVLLVEPTYKPGWEIPGGMVEPGESPLGGCRRELVEELGLAPPDVLALLLVEWISPGPKGPGGMRWVFDGGVLSRGRIDAIRLPPDELRSFRFVAAAEIQDYMPPIRARRVEHALVARKAGFAVYLEDGELPSATSP